MENKKILIIGGARSGKTTFSLDIGKSLMQNAQGLYVATGEARDEEMAQKIKLHQAERGDNWDTLEEPVEIVTKLQKLDKNYGVVLIDCLTLWTSNLIEKRSGKEEEYFIELYKWLRDVQQNVVIVTNEVGLGIVPGNPIARKYRELLGRLNQRIAKIADEVYLVIAGLSMKLKGGE